MADVVQGLDNIKSGIYNFYIHHNLTVGFLRHCGCGVPRNFVRGIGEGDVQQIQLKAQDRENGDLGAVAP
jgi:hypothetical protein